MYQQKQSKQMTSKELNKLKESLRVHSGAKYEIAVALGVDPSKITKALDGLVRSKDFMSRLQAKAQEILKTRKAVSVH
jgi:hypothetical protein